MKPSKKRKHAERGWALRSKAGEQAFIGAYPSSDNWATLTFRTREEAIKYRRGRSWPNDWAIVRVNVTEV